MGKYILKYIGLKKCKQTTLTLISKIIDVTSIQKIILGEKCEVMTMCGYTRDYLLAHISTDLLTTYIQTLSPKEFYVFYL